jgi:hypothetical protein
MLWQRRLNTKLTEHAIPLYLPFNLPLIPPGGVLLQGVVVFHLAAYENERRPLQFIATTSHEAIGSDHGADENTVFLEGVEPDYIIYRFAELRRAIEFFERL